MGYGDRPAGSRLVHTGGLAGVGASAPYTRKRKVRYEERVTGAETARTRDRGPADRAAGRVAVCVLGCRSQSAALARRAGSASALWKTCEPALVVACGGIAWGGRVEADEIARLLEEAGVPESRIVRERRSRDTPENAQEAARLLERHAIEDVILVTCTWHLRRATRLFERAGLRVVDAVGVPPPDPGLIVRTWWPIRERMAWVKDLVLHHRAREWGRR
jgi:hypothetical protein